MDNGFGTCWCSRGYLSMENAFAQHYSVILQILWQSSGAEPQGDYNSAASDGLKCTMRGVAQETEKSLTGVWMAGRAFCLVFARYSFSQMSSRGMWGRVAKYVAWGKKW